MTENLCVDMEVPGETPIYYQYTHLLLKPLLVSSVLPKLHFCQKKVELNLHIYQNPACNETPRCPTRKQLSHTHTLWTNLLRMVDKVTPEVSEFWYPSNSLEKSEEIPANLYTLCKL